MMMMMMMYHVENFRMNFVHPNMICILHHAQNVNAKSLFNNIYKFRAERYVK